MSIAFQLPRSLRRQDYTALLGQLVYGPLPWFAFDAADIRVRWRLTATAPWQTLTTGYSVSLSGSTAGYPTITLAIPFAAGTLVRIEGARTHDRITDVTRAGALLTAAAERELDKITTVLQENRRDLDDADLQLVSQQIAQSSMAAQFSLFDASLAGIEMRLGTTGGPQVHLYNAVLDGLVDNSGIGNARLQLEAAIDLAANSGKTLWIPDGIYNLGGDTLTITRPNAKIWCQSENVVIRRTVTGAAPLVKIDADGVSWVGGKLVHVPSTFGVTGDNVAILNNRRRNVSIEHVRIEGRFYVGVHHESAINPLTFNAIVRGVVNRSFYSSFLITPAERANHRYLDCIADGREVGGSSPYTMYGCNTNAYGLAVAIGVNISGCIAQHCTSQGFGSSERVYDTRVFGCHAWYITAGVGFLFQKANGFVNDRSGAYSSGAMFCQQGFYIADSNFVQFEGIHAGLNTSHGIAMAGASGCRITGLSEYNAGSGVSIQTGTVISQLNRIDVASHNNTGWGISEAAASIRNNYAGSLCRNNTAGEYQILGSNPGVVGTL
jgi:hypothetical protein